VEQAADGDTPRASVESVHAEAETRCGEVELESVAHHWALAALRLTYPDLKRIAFHVPFFLGNAIRGTGDPAHDPEALNGSYLALLRDVVYNPFRGVDGRPTVRERRSQELRFFKPTWRTSTVSALAEGVYADRAFDRLPILADALEDAGCDSAELLAHFRGPGTHARGCWALDLVLGKA